MRCWSCGKKIPDDANRCRFCEAKVDEEPTKEEIEAVKEMLTEMSPDMMAELRDAFEKSTTGEEFVNRIMVGDCPTCGSSNTKDCESDPDIEDPCVGKCIDCGQYWCLECDRTLDASHPSCEKCIAEWEEEDDGLEGSL